MNKLKFIISLVLAASLFLLVLMIGLYMIIVRPTLFADTDKVVFNQRILFQFPYLIIVLFVILFDTPITIIMIEVMKRKERRKERQNIIENLDDYSKQLISQITLDRDKYFEEHREQKARNKQLEKENKEMKLAIENTGKIIEDYKGRENG